MSALWASARLQNEGEAVTDDRSQARPKTCAIAGCDRPFMAKGYCNPHYQSLLKYGDPLKARRAKSPGHISVNIRGYKVIRRNGKSVFEHIAIAERALGKPLPPKAVVHHVDGNPSNNAPSNLVICPSQEYHLQLHSRQGTLTRKVKAKQP